MPQTEEEIRKGLIGTWKLISLVSKPIDSDGPIGYPFGPNAAGYLIYTSEGYMSAQVMAPGSKHYAKADPFSAPDDEAGEAARHFLAYSGPFEVFFQDGQPFVKHSTDLSLVPNWAGGHQLRRVELDGDKLVLSPDRPWEICGVWVNQYLTWERM
ncbi:hypothetical protein N7493_008362 [Penicillium malachiteum]|uniref:Lipocalin-like domain-containing protein n=1 Tax=Penicillium malachiteum TaxID=1324776 RepID=A0AAD6HH42_9EURO|nr:hypothetical protein N7493_008362 [Penicillium malachiteum]